MIYIPIGYHCLTIILPSSNHHSIIVQPLKPLLHHGIHLTEPSQQSMRKKTSQKTRTPSWGLVGTQPAFSKLLVASACGGRAVPGMPRKGQSLPSVDGRHYTWGPERALGLTGGIWRFRWNRDFTWWFYIGFYRVLYGFIWLHNVVYSFICLKRDDNGIWVDLPSGVIKRGWTISGRKNAGKINELNGGFSIAAIDWLPWYTLWVFNIAMENCLLIDDFPINTSIYKGFSMAMLNTQMVITVDGRTYETSHIWMIWWVSSWETVSLLEGKHGRWWRRVLGPPLDPHPKKGGWV